MKNSEKAVKLFTEGYNCAQAVFAAFAEDIGFDKDIALKIAAPFGGGFGRQREVCGAVSGMLMVFGYLYGYETPETGEIKMKHYEQTREMCDKFKEINGSYICRELMNLPEGSSTPEPEARTESYYKKRPCAELVGIACDILDKYFKGELN